MDTNNKDNECKLLPCNMCKMFRLLTPEELLWITQHSTAEKVNFGCLTMTCPSCIEKQKLVRNIEILKSKINYLNGRVASLRKMRENENFIDKSMNELSERFDLLQASDNSNNLTVNSFAENVTIIDSTDASQFSNLNNTSVWTDTTTIFDDILVGLQQKVNPNTGPDHVQEMHSSENYPLNNILLPAVSDISTTISEQYSEEGFGNDDPAVSNLDESESPHAQVNDFNDSWYNNIKLLVIGDENISSFYIDNTQTKYQDPESVFKVACPNALLGDLVDTAIFFLEKFPKVETVIFHGGTTVMKRGRTEIIKKMYTNLINRTESMGVNLVISGPFPNAYMTSQTFSRTASVNRWLNNADYSHLSIANILTLFGRKLT